MSNQTNPTPVALMCSECGQGHYYRFFNLSPIFECEECGHGLTAEDVDLEQGETVTITAHGALAYLPATDDYTSKAAQILRAGTAGQRVVWSPETGWTD